MSIGIYKIVNKINGKCYIGKSANIEQRFKKHKNKMSYGTEVIYQAFRKYGIENFDFLIIEELAAKYLIDNNFTKASLNTVRGHIGQNCAGKEKTSYSFIWEWF